MKDLGKYSNQVDEGFDEDLIAHARRALVKVHMTEENSSQPSHSREEARPKQIKNKKSSHDNNDERENKNAKVEKKITYLSIKKPPQRSTFYQHSKDGMKYWYEDKAKKPYATKVLLGRTGTLLGIADSLLK